MSITNVAASGGSALSYAGLALLNITASILSSYYPSALDAAGRGGVASLQAHQPGSMHNMTCGVMNATCTSLSPEKHRLIFGEMKGLLPQPQKPGGR